MEERNHDGPFAVWQMFNAPTMVLFNNLERAEDGLDRLLTSILKLSGDSSEVLVPRSGYSKCLEDYYSAFNTWLLGRLFYVCSVHELQRIHSASKDAQLKILNFLCMNRASFYDRLHEEYYCILQKLAQFYEDFHKDLKDELIINNFTPIDVNIPQVKLNLEPIHARIKDITTCKHLIDIVLQLLAESIPPSLIYQKNAENEHLFCVILHMLENFSVDIKLVCFRFFVELISNMKNGSVIHFHSHFKSVQSDMLLLMETFAQSIGILYEKGEVNDGYLNIFNTLLLKLLRMVYHTEHQHIIVNIATIILNEKNSKMFDTELKIFCLSLSKIIEFPKEVLKLQNRDSTEIENLFEYFSQSIINTLKKDTNKTALVENWFYNETLEVIKSVKSCENLSDAFLTSHYLQRCKTALKLLQYTQSEHRKQIFKELEFLNRDVTNCVWTTLLKIIKQSVFNNEDTIHLIMEIMLTINLLTERARKDDIGVILQITCLQTNEHFSEQSLTFNDQVKAVILEYLLFNKLVLKGNVTEAWNNIVTVLCSTLLRSKPAKKQIILLSPLLLANKVLSSSKLISDILLPAFLTRDKVIQDNIVSLMPMLVCMSLSTYSVAKTNDRGYMLNELGISIVCHECHRENKSINNDSTHTFKKKYREFCLETNAVTLTNISLTNALKSLFGKFLNFEQYVDLDISVYWGMIGAISEHFYVFEYGVSTSVINQQNMKYILKAFKPFLECSEKNEDSPINETVFTTCVNLILESTRESLESNDYSVQSETLDCVKRLGLYRNSKLLLPVTKLLVYFIMQPQCSLAPKAVVYLRDVCELQGFTPNQTYQRYKKDYCRLFVVCSLNNGKDFAMALLKVVRAFGFVGYRDFISKDVHHFLPYLIPYCVLTKEIPFMIEEIASLVQCSVSDFLIERFPHIYVHVYLTESKEVSKKCYDIIEKMTKMSMLTLIKRHFRVIITEFLLQYCCNPEKVLNACRYLACHDPDVSTPQGSMSMSASQIADFLNPKFLGVLAYFDHKLVNAKVALSVKRKALKSFPDMMQLMGVKYLTPLRFKVLATLRSALPLVKEFPKILAEAWSAFIHNIDTVSLGPLLPNLAVSLLQQIEYAPQEINNIFRYLILNNENLLSSSISELFFVEDARISEKVKIVIKRHVRRTQPDCFLDKIKWYLQHLNQDIPIIKAFSFSRLDSLLKSNRKELHAAIFGGKNIDPVIVELIDCLLVGCKDPTSEVSSSSGWCLGQLGAIEAGHLPRQYVQPDGSPFAFSINDNCFAATALVELTRAFQYEKDTMNMDCYALTIQEILKIYDISPTGSKKEVWDSFPENMHQIMFPLLSSRYTLAYPSQAKKAHPLFGSMYATTFLEWAHNWSGQLIPLIESDTTRELLRTVHPSMRRDVRTLFLFLPYVLLHAVMSKNNVQYIQEEMLAVIDTSADNCENISSERSKYKMIRHIRMTPNIHSIQAEEGNQSKCGKTVYTLLDFFNRWLLEWMHSKQRPLENENYKAILKFMEKFDKLAIARGNFACGELERALQYLELYMDGDRQRVQSQLPFLAEIYALLDEPDSVAGILSMKRSEPSLKELILAQVVTGRLQDAALCYERLAQQGQLDRHSLQGMIDCYLGLDQPFTAYRLLSEQEMDASTKELSAEPLWRLGRFEQLDELVAEPVPQSRENWGLLMGRILLSYRKQEEEAFEASCTDAVSRLLLHMDGESRGESALRSGYQSVLGVHIISEVRRAQEALQGVKSLQDGESRGELMISRLLEEWRQRLSLVQSDVRTVEPLLRIRRILLQQTQELLAPTHPTASSKLRACIGDLWLQSAKHARKAGNFQQAYMYILNAEEYRPEQLLIEKAKMYWARGQREQAFTTLRRGLDDAYPHTDALTQQQRKTCAKAKLLIAKYNDETTNVDVDVNIGYYQEAVDVFTQWEKSLVCLGSYYEKVSGSEAADDGGATWTRRVSALNSYGKALRCGHKYLYQSMPRMLSIWLDVEVTSSDTSVHSVLAQMTEIIKTYSERLPTHLYLTAFSQIVSRICHPVKEVYLQLKAIIVKLILAYPQHTLWMMLSVIKSSYPQRMKRCADVFSDPRLKEPQMLKLVSDFTQFAEKLIELCNKPIVGTGSTTTVSSLVRTLPRLLAADSFSHIMMPFEEFCKIVLPSKAARQERVDFNLPAEPPVYVAGIDEQIQILPSLQKPRKVTLKGSDGKSYIIMLKPRDDLRKDFRLMEFNGVVNRFLQDAAESRRRRLYIRTYCVLPLNEECGLIEWLPRLVGLRPVLMHLYKQKGIHTSNRELKEMMCLNKDPVEKKRRIFEQQLLPRHPPVFHEWFRRVFSDPYGWYQARSAYIRTTAVMSMVGYILGLGDRHGENISFDSTNGDTVHVDFNCLFNKGEAFEWPERVPFRLTHNMEAAMGPLRHEGMFRKSCEAVMRVLREQTLALMSVIGPFVYDPLVSWGRGRLEAVERTNEQALHHLKHIRLRLNGMVKTKNKQLSLSLSAEGQVEHLIVEATSVHNLCQMYIGWGPFL